MPRVLQLVALSLALLLVGAPAVIAELVEDDCGEACAGDDEGTSCPDEGCTDCSVVCASCPRPHVLPATVAAWFAPWRAASVERSPEASERVPTGPPPEGVFHPPRRAA